MPKPTISLIAALSKNHVIGKDNQLPWHLPNDFDYFKSSTLNKPIVMGRKTFESLGKPLPKRRNVIITRQTDFQINDCEVFSTIDAALDALADEPEIMIIGGATIYEQTIDRADYLYLTIVDAEINGDTYFPKWHDTDWQVISEKPHTADAQHAFSYTFLILKKI